MIHDIDPSDRWDLDRERPVPNTDYTLNIPSPGKEDMTTIVPKRADELLLGDRLSIPGTQLSSEIRFLHRDGTHVTVELKNANAIVFEADSILRVVAS